MQAQPTADSQQEGVRGRRCLQIFTNQTGGAQLPTACRARGPRLLLPLRARFKRCCSGLIRTWRRHCSGSGRVLSAGNLSHTPLGSGARTSPPPAHVLPGGGPPPKPPACCFWSALLPCSPWNPHGLDAQEEPGTAMAPVPMPVALAGSSAVEQEGADDTGRVLQVRKQGPALLHTDIGAPPPALACVCVCVCVCGPGSLARTGCRARNIAAICLSGSACRKHVRASRTMMARNVCACGGRASKTAHLRLPAYSGGACQPLSSAHHHSFTPTPSPAKIKNLQKPLPLTRRPHLSPPPLSLCLTAGGYHGTACAAHPARPPALRAHPPQRAHCPAHRARAHAAAPAARAVRGVFARAGGRQLRLPRHGRGGHGRGAGGAEGGGAAGRSRA